MAQYCCPLKVFPLLVCTSVDQVGFTRISGIFCYLFVSFFGSVRVVNAYSSFFSVTECFLFLILLDMYVEYMYVCMCVGTCTYVHMCGSQRLTLNILLITLE